MVSKLLFKGDKKSKKSSRRNVPSRVTSKVQQRSKHEAAKKYYINGTPTKLEDIDLEKITNGWTNLYREDLKQASPSLLDTEAGKLPVIVTFNEGDRHMCMNVVKYTTEDAVVKTRIQLDDDYELSEEATIVIFTKEEVSLEDVRNRIEPKHVSQVFILSDVTSIFQSSAKFIEGEESAQKERMYSLKSSDGEFIVMDPTTHELKLSFTLTSNGICTLLPEMIDGIPHYRIILGPRDDANTMMVTSSNDIKVIPDPEDLPESASRFILRLRIEDALQTKQIVQELANEESQLQLKSGSSHIEGDVKKTVMELTKLGFRINDKVFAQISRAYKEGNINEWLVEFKEKNLHDRRA